jgi:hypothetical protein
MSGQFLVDPVGAEPVGALFAVEVEEGVERLLAVLPDEAVDVVVPLLALDALVAALATSAPPETSPPVSAPAARAVRSRSFMVGCPSFVVRFTSVPVLGEH